MRPLPKGLADQLREPGPAVRSLSDGVLLGRLLAERHAMVKPCTRPGVVGSEWQRPASAPYAGPAAMVAEESRARQLCAGCPVIEVCLEIALREPIEGVQGGTTERGRAVLLVRRQEREQQEQQAVDGRPSPVEAVAS